MLQSVSMSAATKSELVLGTAKKGNSKVKLGVDRKYQTASTLQT